MRYIFIGLILNFLDFNVNFGSSNIELLPDFVGYILMYQGMKELSGDSEWFRKLPSFTIAMAIYSGIIFVLELFGMSTESSIWLFIILGIISQIISLYIIYGIIMGIMDMERDNTWELYSEPLFSAWKVIVVCSILVIPLMLVLPVLSLIGAIIQLIASIYFLISFNRTKNAYYNYF
ncbi:MAG: hypothetical protein GX306_11930 [Clostridiales bacterium]|nr:hypothetical protein [Clostridiales bacterium]